MALTYNGLSLVAENFVHRHKGVGEHTARLADSIHGASQYVLPYQPDHNYSRMFEGLCGSPQIAHIREIMSKSRAYFADTTAAPAGGSAPSAAELAARAAAARAAAAAAKAKAGAAGGAGGLGAGGLPASDLGGKSAKKAEKAAAKSAAKEEAAARREAAAAEAAARAMSAAKSGKGKGKGAAVPSTPAFAVGARAKASKGGAAAAARTAAAASGGRGRSLFEELARAGGADSDEEAGSEGGAAPASAAKAEAEGVEHIQEAVESVAKGKVKIIESSRGSGKYTPAFINAEGRPVPYNSADAEKSDLEALVANLIKVRTALANRKDQVRVTNYIERVRKEIAKR